MRRDQEYWQRLRKDVPSNAAAILAAIAALAATLSVVVTAVGGTQYEARGNPLYWLLMLPMAWWVSGLTTFAPRFVQTWKPAMAIACAASMGSAALSIRGGFSVTGAVVACIVTVAAAAASLIVYRYSLVAREGPAR